jgi:hypothetical protein
MLTGSVPGATGHISALFADDDVHVFSLTTQPIPATDSSKPFNRKQANRVMTQWKAPVGTTTTVTVTPYVDGDLTNAIALATSATVPHEDSATGKRVVVDCGQFAADAHLVQLKLAGTAAAPIRLESMLAEVADGGTV